MTEQLNIDYVPIQTLLPYQGNARTHSKTQIRQIAKSIRAFGFINPLIIDEAGQVVAGHGRLLAAQELGLARIPCIRIDHLSEAEKRAYLLADNKLTENAGWDAGLLRIELEFLSDTDLDIELTGFSISEIDSYLTFDEADKPEPPVLAPPSLCRTISRPGDLWQLGAHRLICGDCRDPGVMDRLMGKEQARLIATDPPYNVRISGHAGGLGQIQHPDFMMASGEMTKDEFTAFLTDSLSQLCRSSLDGSLHYIFIDWRHLGELSAAGKSVYGEDAQINLCVWCKSNGGMGSLYRSQHELVFVFKNGRAPHINNVQLGKNGRYRTNTWNYAGVNAFGGDREVLALHPTVKPVRLIADAILDVSKRGEIVLDGFAGSGSTLLAAEQTGRIFRGVEIDPRYVDVIIQRWSELTGEDAIHMESGKTFADLGTARIKNVVAVGKE